MKDSLDNLPKVQRTAGTQRSSCKTTIDHYAELDESLVLTNRSRGLDNAPPPGVARQSKKAFKT